MSKKIRKFRPNENVKSIEFTKKLNAIVDAVYRANNLTVNVKNGTGGIRHFPKGHSININIPRGTTIKGNNAINLNYFWGVITETLSYDTAGADGICEYTIMDIDDYNAGLTSPTYTPRIINNYDADGNIKTTDLREFIPWLEDKALVPIIWYNSNPSAEDEVIDYNNLFILNSFSYTGNNEVKSIAWHESDGRIMSVYA